MEKFTGKVWVLDDDIDTDIIIPTEYLALKTIDDMKQYGFSPLRPELAGQIQKGDIIVPTSPRRRTPPARWKTCSPTPSRPSAMWAARRWNRSSMRVN